MGKKMDYLPAFREHYFVLQPQVLCFYNGTSEKEKRGEILIDGQCRVETIADTYSKSPLKTPGSKHHSKFQVFACQKTYEFQASDHRTRLQWINAIKTAIENAEEPVRYQRALLDKKEIDKARRKRKRRGGRHQKSFTCRLPRPDKNSTRTGKTGTSYGGRACFHIVATEGY